MKRGKRGLRFLWCFVLALALLIPNAPKGYSGEGPSTGMERSVVGPEIQKIRLEVLREDVKKEIEKYMRLKEEIERAKAELEEKRDEKISRVAKIYENMPAEEAARKLEKLDEETVVLIISALRARSAGKIMAQMSPDKAASISRKLLSRAIAVEKFLGK